MTVEQQLVVTLDSAPTSQPDGPWAADVTTHVHGIEDERSARWLTCDDYKHHEHLEMFNEAAYAFIDGDETYYVREQDVADIFEMQEVLPREFPR